MNKNLLLLNYFTISRMSLCICIISTTCVCYFHNSLFWMFGSFWAVFGLLILFHAFYRPYLFKPLAILEERLQNIAISNLINPFSLGDIENASPEMISIKNKIEGLLINLNKDFQTEKKRALVDLATKLTHDLRSPIAVMEMTLDTNGHNSKETEIHIQKNALQCMRDITNELLKNQ